MHLAINSVFSIACARFKGSADFAAILSGQPVPHAPGVTGNRVTVSGSVTTPTDLTELTKYDGLAAKLGLDLDRRTRF